MFSAFFIIILRKPEKQKLMEIDESTDIGKILAASRKAKNLLAFLEKFRRNYTGFDFGDVLSSDGNDPIRIGKKSTTIQEFISEKLPELNGCVWLVAFTDPDIDYGTDKNTPIAAALYDISESYTGSYPTIKSNEKDAFSGKLAECLEIAKNISLGTFTIFSEEGEEEEIELIDGDNEPSAIL
jgi:hypothetical protein